MHKTHEITLAQDIEKDAAIILITHMVSEDNCNTISMLQELKFIANNQEYKFSLSSEMLLTSEKFKVSASELDNFISSVISENICIKE